MEGRYSSRVKESLTLAESSRSLLLPIVTQTGIGSRGHPRCELRADRGGATHDGFSHSPAPATRPSVFVHIPKYPSVTTVLEEKRNKPFQLFHFITSAQKEWDGAHTAYSIITNCPRSNQALRLKGTRHEHPLGQRATHCINSGPKRGGFVTHAQRTTQQVLSDPGPYVRSTNKRTNLDKFMNARTGTLDPPRKTPYSTPPLRYTCRKVDRAPLTSLSFFIHGVRTLLSVDSALPREAISPVSQGATRTVANKASAQSTPVRNTTEGFEGLPTPAWCGRLPLRVSG